jgi:hypothetical protein
MPVGDGT